MEDVARTAAVSTATVSRVLNTPDLVAPETLQRVHRAIAKLGYRPNVFAQGLTTKRSHLLGILLPDIHGEFYSELLRGADRVIALTESERTLLASNCPEVGPRVRVVGNGVV